METRPNNRDALDAVGAFCLHYEADSGRADEAARYSVMVRHISIVIPLASFVLLCGCTSSFHERRVAPAVELTLYEINETPLANLQLLLPTAISTDWSDGQWRGELAVGHVRLGEHMRGSEYMLNAPSWQRLICRIDFDDVKFIRINLQPNQPMDHINIWLPLRRGSSAESRRYEWPDGGGCGGGTFTVMEK